MVKSWADHSSDEEDDALDSHAAAVPVANPDVLRQEFAAENNRAMGEMTHDNDEEAQAAPGGRTYNYPTAAPFTAYVGNLAYTIMDAADLKQGLTELVQSVLGSDKAFTIVDARIMMERQDRDRDDPPRHRGFGYVEVETLDMLHTLMELNAHKALLAGRQPVLDPQTSAPKGRGGGGRGGGGSGSFPDGGQFRGGRFAPRGDGGAPPPPKDDGRQRPSLKLAPRSAPKASGSGGAPAQASLFGGGKARDEKSWQERRKTEGKPEGRGSGGRGGDRERRRAPKEGSTGREGFGSGRGGGGHKEGGRGGGHKEGGRGGGGGHKEGGRGGGHKEGGHKEGGHKEGGRGRGPRAAAKETKEGGWHDKPAHTKEGETPVLKVAPVAVPAKAAEAPVEKKVVNKFAALDFSDSE